MSAPRLTYEEAIARLVALDVARWGESERAASERMRRRNSPTIGLALNSLAHHDVDAIDAEMAAQAEELLTDADWRSLRSGG